MGLDLRWPIGLMFSIIGTLLTVNGLLTRGGEQYHRSLGINVNLRWGLVLLVFGIFMLIMAIKGSKNAGRDDKSSGPQDKK